MSAIASFSEGQVEALRDFLQFRRVELAERMNAFIGEKAGQ